MILRLGIGGPRRLDRLAEAVRLGQRAPGVRPRVEIVQRLEQRELEIDPLLNRRIGSRGGFGDAFGVGLRSLTKLEQGIPPLPRLGLFIDDGLVAIRRLGQPAKIAGGAGEIEARQQRLRLQLHAASCHPFGRAAAIDLDEHAGEPAQHIGGRRFEIQ